MEKISVFKCTLMLAELFFFCLMCIFCQYVFFLSVCVSVAVCQNARSLHNKYTSVTRINQRFCDQLSKAVEPGPTSQMIWAVIWVLNSKTGI